MLEIQRIRTEKDSVIEGLKKRHFDAKPIVDAVLNADENWRSNKTEMETISAQLNQISKEIGDLFKSGKVEEANQAKAQTVDLKAKESALKEKKIE